MSELENKEMIQRIFADLAKGDDKSFIDAMADEMKWIWMGSGELSKTFNGKSEVLGKLWKSVRETLKPPYKVSANNFIAEDNYVAIEATGQNSTPDGKIYHNKYCWICKVSDGRVYELREYMDTDLVTRTFTEKAVQIVGKRFRVDFGKAKAILYFQKATSLQFTITEKDNKPCLETETVEIKLTEIRPNLYLTSWKEKNLNTVTQIQDFSHGIVYSNWTLPSGEFINVQGAILPADDRDC